MHSARLSNVYIVARREYIERVRTKAFFIMTLITPGLIFIWAVVPSMMFGAKAGGHRTLVVASADDGIAHAVKAKLEAPPAPAKPGEARKAGEINSGYTYTVETSNDVSPEGRAELQREIDSGKIDGFLWLDAKALEKHEFDYVAHKTADIMELGTLSGSVRDAMVRQQLVSRGISANDTDAVLKSWDMRTTKWDKGKATTTNEFTQFMGPFIIAFAMYLTVMIYGIGVMRAILEEKSNRVMEVLLSSLNTTELMAGKIVGVGMAGITQIALWVGIGAVISVPGAMSIGSLLRQSNFSLMTGIYFGVFFLLGYFLYSSMCAALGAMVNSDQEAQQLQMFVMMPLIFSFMFIFYAMRAPDAPIVVAISMVPFAAPLVMFTRIVVSTPPAWQIALSIALMLGGIAVVVWISSRIYRVGVLMYGKRPTLPEIIKWIRYA